MTQVLTFYLSAEKAGVMPEGLMTQFQGEEQVWEAFLENKAGMAVVWSSRFLEQRPDGVAIAPIPTESGEPFTLATGWVWALAGRDEGKRKLTVELAEFLTEGTFPGHLDESRRLPADASQLFRSGVGRPAAQTIGTIARTAQLLPATDVLSSLGNPLQQAVMAVLKEKDDPALAAQAAAASLTGP